RLGGLRHSRRCVRNLPYRCGCRGFGSRRSLGFGPCLRLCVGAHGRSGRSGQVVKVELRLVARSGRRGSGGCAVGFAVVVAVIGVIAQVLRRVGVSTFGGGTATPATAATTTAAA